MQFPPLLRRLTFVGELVERTRVVGGGRPSEYHRRTGDRSSHAGRRKISSATVSAEALPHRPPVVRH
ncbi:hypothetical protein A2U01_0028637 [Trifolium medium]|uniref:Uncharacterized protein n=1 Tax=Trifolium medium TaxID=97028 RepID=A0A392P686_9FABA|nr:hypothetical protein [Trifolium medium]